MLAVCQPDVGQHGKLGVKDDRGFSGASAKLGIMCIACVCRVVVMQGLQKERESLTTQLRAAGPEQVQRLAAEVGSLRTAAAEASIAKEQAEHSTKQWQEAERRLAELQVTRPHVCCKRNSCLLGVASDALLQACEIYLML